MVRAETWALLSASLLNSVSAENVVRECVPFCRELDLCSSMAQSDVSADAFASRACRILLREAARDGAGADPLFKYLGMFQVSSSIFFNCHIPGIQSAVFPGYLRKEKEEEEGSFE